MKIRVEFEVPDDIANGLKNGTLERVGGVIRFADSKQIVAWLRDGGNISRSSSSNLTLLPTLLQATGMNARTVAVVAGAVTVAGPLLDIAITAITIHHLTRRIAALEKKIAEIYDRIDRNFAKVQAADLQTALQTAKELLKTEDLVSRREKANDVIARLVKSEKLLLMDLDDALNGSKRPRARVIIDTLISVNLLAARCSSAVGDEKIAISRLNNSLVELKPRVERLVRMLIGKQPALFFHNSVKNHYLVRYITIRAWLDGEANIWEIVVKEARKDFWKKKALKRLFRRYQKFLHVWHEPRKNPFYIKTLPKAEQLIENFQRFESFALDLESSDRLSDELENLSDKAAKRLAEHDDYVLIINEDAIGSVQRLSA